MAFSPPKGIAPPQLAGRRTGRPKGSKNHARIWADALWGFQHRHDEDAVPPTPAAWLWWGFAQGFPGELEDFLVANGRL
jgi:hypothetical protein